MQGVAVAKMWKFFQDPQVMDPCHNLSVRSRMYFAYTRYSRQSFEPQVLVGNVAMSGRSKNVKLG